MSTYKSQYISTVRNKLEVLGLVNKNSWKYQEYTLSHKIAFVDVFKILTGYLTDAAFAHDTDKLVLYGIMSKDEASRLHRQISGHHINNSDTEEKYLNCITDYECARFTKKDKPLNAHDTVLKYCPDKSDILGRYLDNLGINSSNTNDFANIALRENVRVTRVGEFISDELYGHLLDATINHIDIIYTLYMKYGAKEAVKTWEKSINWNRKI